MLVGISGKIGTGKSTVAKTLSRLFGPNATVMGFGDALREEVAAVLGLGVPDVRAPVFKGRLFTVGARLMTGRQVLQWWGTDVRRAADPGYWAREAVKRALTWLKDHNGGPVIFDDVRFPSEAEAIHAHAGLVFRLEPHEAWRPGPGAGHESETSLDHFQGFDGVFCPVLGGLGPVAEGIAEEVGMVMRVDEALMTVAMERVREQAL